VSLFHAKKYAKKAIDAYKDTIGARCSQVKVAYELLAKICIQTGDIIEAYQIIEE
jgi:hypothetical protein